MLSGRWSWGVLLSDPRQADAEWALTLQLIHNPILTLTQRQGLPVSWLPAGYCLHQLLVDPKNETPYRQGARRLASRERNQSLWSDYQENIQASLKQLDEEHKRPRGRLIAQQGMKLTLNFVPPVSTIHPETLEVICDPVQSLQRPLLCWLRDIATYYGLAPDTPENLLAQLEKNEHFRPDFIADLQAAYAWVTEKVVALQEAWRNQTPPTGLRLGQAQLCQDPQSGNGFQCSAAEYRHHHRYTLTLLQQTWPETLGRWPRAQEVRSPLDPLVVQAQKLLEQAASPELLDEEAHELLKEVVELVRHRPRDSWSINTWLVF